jgi:peptide/nickel transport system substrate-binding protein
VLLSSKNATEEEAQNIAYYQNPEVDELLNQAVSTTEESERRELYYEAQEIINSDAPWVPIAYAEPPLGFKNRVEGYLPSPTGGEPFNTVKLSGSGA